MMRASPSFSAAAGLLAIVVLVVGPALATPVRKADECIAKCEAAVRTDGDQAKFQTDKAQACAASCAGAISQSAGGGGGEFETGQVVAGQTAQPAASGGQTDQDGQCQLAVYSATTGLANPIEIVDQACPKVCGNATLRSCGEDEDERNPGSCGPSVAPGCTAALATLTPGSLSAFANAYAGALTSPVCAGTRFAAEGAQVSIILQNPSYPQIAAHNIRQECAGTSTNGPPGCIAAEYNAKFGEGYEPKQSDCAALKTLNTASCTGVDATTVALFTENDCAIFGLDDDGPPACIAAEYSAVIGNREPIFPDDCPELFSLYQGKCDDATRAEIKQVLLSACRAPLTAADITFGGAVEYAFHDPFCQFVRSSDSSSRQRRGTEECIAQCEAAVRTDGDKAKFQTCATGCAPVGLEAAFAEAGVAAGQSDTPTPGAEFETAFAEAGVAAGQSDTPTPGAEFETALAGAGGAAGAISQSAGGGDDDDDGPPECIAQQYATRVGDRDPEKADCPALKSLNLAGCADADVLEINFFVGSFCAEPTKATYAGDGTSCGSHTYEDGSQVYVFMARFGIEKGGYCHSADAAACGKALANFKTNPNKDPSAGDLSVTCIMAGQEECVFDPEIGAFARVTFARNQIVEARISAIDVDELVSTKLGSRDEFTAADVAVAIQDEVGVGVDVDDLIRQLQAEKAQLQITLLEQELASLADGTAEKAQKQADLALKKQATGQSVSLESAEGLGNTSNTPAPPGAGAAGGGMITLTKAELIALIASLQKDSAGGKEAAAQLEKTDPKFKAQSDLRAAKAELERVNSDPNSSQAQKDAAAAAVTTANNQQAAAAAGGTAGSPAASVTASVASAVAAVLLAALC